MSVGLLPTAPSSGITASKKGMARSANLGGWDREFAACGERKTSSGKKRQPPGVCSQASIWKEHVCLYNSRPPDLLRGLKFQRQGHVSPLPFEILAKTFLADCRSAHEEASSGSVLDITGCLPGLSSSRGLSLLVGPMSPLGEGCALFLHTAKGWRWSKLVLSEVKERQIGWIFKLLLCCTPPGPTRAKQVPCGP